MSTVTEYERPAIRRLKSGAMNKYGTTPSWQRRPRSHIDGVAVAELTERYGSPLFVFSEATIRKRIHAVREAFSSRYPRVELAWSYKTNYLDAIAAVFHQEGSLAEVVSEMEYDKARRLGVPGERIIFNGPSKSPEALRRAVREGAMIHIDHHDEIDDLEAIAEELDEVISVALRLNLDCGIAPQWNRFGFNLESGQALDAARRIHHNRRLYINGLHCHIGTYILDPKAYQRQVEKMVRFAYQLEELFDNHIDYLDIGGGMPSHARLRGSYLPSELGVPTIDDYATAIAEGLGNTLRPGHLPQVFLESGRSLIDEAGSLITSVHASKRLPDGRKGYVLDAGVNLLYTSTWYRPNVELDREVTGEAEPAILYGPLCMNIDVLDEGAMLPSLARGTRLILSPVGAYNVTQWMQFITYRPAVVMIDEQGEVQLIRERETLDDLVGRERLPTHLKNLHA